MSSKRTEELDFSPFNAEDVLTALCKVLRTSRAISFSYAGDIQSVVDRIGRVFHAERCMMLVAAKDQVHVETFEYLAEGIDSVSHMFAGVRGQAMAHELIGLDGDINAVSDVANASNLDGGYFLPLKIRGDSRNDGKERRAGLLYIKDGPLSRWNKLVLESLVVVADHLARLAQIEQISSTLGELESEDKVTGFLHRKFASEAAAKELARAEFFGDQASLMLIDLDLGGRSPDVYGTALGEAVIKTVASAIAAGVRGVDICGRIGLDEFLVFCPRLDQEEAGKLAAYLVKRINESLMNLTRNGEIKAEVGVFVPTTASVGLAHSRKGEAFEALYSAAQESLNAARQAGGNMVKSV
ncbi:MAG: GGDEF domain-containing protein [Cyanobacteria bacterium SZAS LIN-2]|nr:GGDEF domain-containing protein [Cyanobacteria bacterium SZAS LIN-2]MBS2009563.1 GGDEF domain-containing protein [Cyanobacteria bacterium SZAS TMP-1]